MYSRHQRKLRLFYALADAGLVWLAFVSAYQMRLLLPLQRTFQFDTLLKALLLLVSILAFWGVALWFGIYERLDGADRRQALSETARQVFSATVCVVLAQFLLRLDVSRAFLGLFCVLSFVGLAVFRWNARPLLRWYRQTFGDQHYIWIVGTGESARRVAAAVEAAQTYGLRLSGFLDVKPAVGVIELRQEYPVHELSTLSELLRRRVIDEILFAVSSDELASLEETFLMCDEEGVRTRIAVDFFPHIRGDVYLDRLGEAPLLTYNGAPHDEVRLLVKRGIDIVLATVALACATPFLLLVALAVRLTSRGEVIFRQERCGLNGRRFWLYKFRSMVANAEELKEALSARNEKQLVFKMKDDPRLTPLGKWLRKFSIDELPQLWNVIRGDMSLVGPRPAVPGEVEQYKRWQRRRLRMRPGLTCLWVVEGRDTVDFETWMALDMQYIDTWSLTLDWKIMLRTIPQVVTGKGAH